MALIKCPKCGQMISDKATHCPKCGIPVSLAQSSNQQENTAGSYIYTEESSSKKWLYAVIGILVIALLGLAAWLFIFNDDKQNQSEQIVSTENKNSDKDSDNTATPQSMDLHGYVGKYPITMHLDFDINNVNGYYFYNSGSSKLQLTGTININHIELNETTQEGRPTGHFDGEMVNGEYSGEFINYKGEHFNFSVTNSEMTGQENVLSRQEETIVEESTQQIGIRCELMGNISTIEDVKMVLHGSHGTLTYVMDGERINSNIEVDFDASDIDENGLGHLVLKSFTPNGKLKGRFIGEMDSAECGYLYEGHFINVNGGSTTFFLSE